MDTSHCLVMTSEWQEAKEKYVRISNTLLISSVGIVRGKDPQYWRIFQIKEDCVWAVKSIVDMAMSIRERNLHKVSGSVASAVCDVWQKS